MTPEFYERVLRTARNLLRGVPQDLARITVEVAKVLRQFEDQQIEGVRKILQTPSGVLMVEHSA